MVVNPGMFPICVVLKSENRKAVFKYIKICEIWYMTDDIVKAHSIKCLPYNSLQLEFTNFS